MNAFYADAILIVHFGFVLFVTGGLALIWIGAALGWRWVRNFWFRIAHLAAIVFVAGEALLGIWCPLTVWEAELRGVRAEQSFIAQWIHAVMYYELPEWLFTIAYVAFALVVAATYWLVPPLRRPA
ncbi:MAG TPA: DUF2784 domain-containing protein [Burkholderiales bacterium]|nr:DUF2784 domain-containing protein [Burkholderiales bacterium]